MDNPRVAPLRTAPEVPADPSLPASGESLRRAEARLFARADVELAEADRSADPADRFLHGHLAAVRVAGVVLARRGEPSRRSRARTVWQMLQLVAPELGAWADYFASGARLRAAADAGDFSAITAERADQLISHVEAFWRAVRELLDVDEREPAGARRAS